jgi:hypothetical protein
MSNLARRLKRLETRVAAAGPAVFRYGWLKSLPDDFVGDRHVAIVKRQATNSPNVEWCEFEERVGPGPIIGPTLYFSGDDMRL